MIVTYSMRMPGSEFNNAAVLMSIVRIMSWTFIFTWFYNNTESVFLMILLHGWTNTVDTYIHTFYPHPIVSFSQVLLPCALAFILVLRNQLSNKKKF